MRCGGDALQGELTYALTHVRRHAVDAVSTYLDALADSARWSSGAV
jgi:hypothetical protein